jgi:hypothetical protein
VFSARVHCPVCGAENVSRRCPHDPSFVAEVSCDEVLAAARRALAAAREEEGAAPAPSALTA